MTSFHYHPIENAKEVIKDRSICPWLNKPSAQKSELPIGSHMPSHLVRATLCNISTFSMNGAAGRLRKNRGCLIACVLKVDMIRYLCSCLEKSQPVLGDSHRIRFFLSKSTTHYHESACSSPVVAHGRASIPKVPTTSYSHQVLLCYRCHRDMGRSHT